MGTTSTLSELVGERMRAKNFSDVSLARAMAKIGCPVDRTSILNLRSGNNLPKIENGKALCQVLGIAPAKLLEAAENQGRQRKAAV